ncbi:PQQ-binding-like beta-propeller repeat protein [Streptomyces sp. I05A-00742]|uniref:outer membrane protein assembly factor BamB family protein n=1 Tax=Streptomyces sp. I05A-00742 TaxID=2732853 RepID=UPI001489F603|nr:PQQ-binding-like beta-propeller repeat protein [Streptomyces sp. I05A-00742]
MRRSGIRALATACAATAALTLLTACGGKDGDGPGKDDGDGGPRSDARSVPAPRRSFDPPRAFDTASAVDLPKESYTGKVTIGGALAGRPPVVLHRTLAHIASADALQTVDASTGRVVSRVGPAREALKPASSMFEASPVQPPAVVETAAVPVVVQPFLVKIPGKGTTAAGQAVEVVVADAVTGELKWRTEVPLPRWEDYSTPEVAVAGVDKGVAVVTATTGDHALTFALSIDTKKPMWQKEFAGVAVAGGVVAGPDPRGIGEKQRLKALDLATGEEKWSTKDDSYESSVRAASPTLLAFSGRDYGSGHGFLRFLDAASGDVRNEPKDDAPGPDCSYDGRSVTVCAGSRGQGPVVALDARTAKELWRLPDQGANRVAPTVTAVHHGLVYGRTANGPVLVDALTGKDVDTKSPLGVAPVLVNGYTAVALDRRTDTLKAYRTKG